MLRSDFIKTSSLAAVGLFLKDNPSKLSTNFEVPEISTLDLGSIKVHGISTGMLRVKKSHYKPSLGTIQILLDPFWTNWLPVYVWVIEHPEGIFLIDTGENTQILQDDYLDCAGVDGWVNKKIIKFGIRPEHEIEYQLKQLNIKPSDIKQVVLTHLHIDHTDGLKFFSDTEIIISQKEFNNPYGAVPCTYPAGLKKTLINPGQEQYDVFGRAYPLTKSGDLFVVPTYGHSNGHQSVILKTKDFNILFAGDTSFDEEQLKKKKVSGISIDKKEAENTLAKIQNFCKTTSTIYLPSHDINSGKRLANKEFTTINNQ